VLYQLILRDKHFELSKLDRQLTVLTDYGADEKNNVGTFGIEGSHDHHDASAGANLAALRADLARLQQASGVTGSFTRVRAAIDAYKDLDDILMHMAICAADQVRAARPRGAGRRSAGAVRTHDGALQARAVRAREFAGLSIRGSPGPGPLRCDGGAGAGSRLRETRAGGTQPLRAVGKLAIHDATDPWRMSASRIPRDQLQE
jgi:hypothetical protein